MYKRILVPVDGSATSKRGLEEAFKLVQDNTRLRVVNIVDEGMIPAATPIRLGRAGKSDFIAGLKASGAKALKAAAAAAAKKQLEVECAQRNSGGSPVSDMILAEARKWKADLLVMGTHGRRGINRLILGSDAARVVHESLIPVLLVRAEEQSR